MLNDSLDKQEADIQDITDLLRENNDLTRKISAYEVKFMKEDNASRKEEVYDEIKEYMQWATKIFFGAILLGMAIGLLSVSAYIYFSKKHRADRHAAVQRNP